MIGTLVVICLIVVAVSGCDEVAREEAAASSRSEADLRDTEHVEADEREAEVSDDPDAPSEKPSLSPAEFEARMKTVQSLYEELWAIREDPEFHELGFLAEGRREWMAKQSELAADEALALELAAKGIAMGDLAVLAREWRASGGRDTEASNILVRAWDKVLGFHHNIQVHEEPSGDAPSPVGMWRVHDSPLIERIEIKKAGENFRVEFLLKGGGTKVEIAKPRVLGTSMKMEWDDPHGDYLLLTGQGSIAVCDELGVVAIGTR